MSEVEHFNPSLLTDLEDVMQVAEGRHGINEHFESILDYFLDFEDEEEMEDKNTQLIKFFEDLNTTQQTQFLENLLFEVFEDKKLAHEPEIIQIRKQISEVQYNAPDELLSALRMVDNIHFEKGKISGRKFIPPLISYLRSNEHQIRRFIGDLTKEHPRKAKAIMREIIKELIKPIPPTGELAA